MQNLLKAIAAGDDAQTEAAVAHLQPSAEPALLHLLQSAEADARWWAARALAHCGGAAAVQPLVSALADADGQVRAAASVALGQLYARSPAAVGLVVDQLAARLTDDEGYVRQAAADALAHCGNAAVPSLAQVLQSDHQGARSRAAAALRKIATLPAAGVLYQQLNDANYLVRTYAYEGLDEMGLLENMLLAV
jgi:HEAT repeat protein